MIPSQPPTLTHLHPICTPSSHLPHTCRYAPLTAPAAAAHTNGSATAPSPGTRAAASARKLPLHEASAAVSREP